MLCFRFSVFVYCISPVTVADMLVCKILKFLTCHSKLQIISVTVIMYIQVIAHSVRRGHGDAHRFEKISNIVKQFKLSCR